MIIGVVATVVILLLVFWFIFTFVVDPQVVIDAVLSLSLWQVGVLSLIAIATYVLQGVTLRSTLRDMGLWNATLAMQASLAVKGSIPGPSDSAFRFRLALAYHYSVEESTLSAATLKALDWLARLLMIPIAVAILLLSGQSIAGLEGLAVTGLVVSVIGIALIVGVVRSEPLARWLGSRLQAVIEWLMGRLHRAAPAGIADRVMGLRAMSSTLVNTKGLLGLALQLILQVGYASILTLAMYFVGVDFDVLPVAVVWAAVGLVYLMPIGPGFIEIAYMAIFALVVGRGDPMLDLVAAGVMIMRVYQWLLPIPIGYGLIVWWQKRDHFALLSFDAAQVQDEPPGARHAP